MIGNKKGKILLIDDDENTGRVISETLGAKGIEVVIVTDPEKAVEKALEVEPDVVFVSFVLPGHNGLKVSRAIHSSEKLKDLPVFLMMAEEFEAEYGDYFGVVNVFTKPLNTEKLLLKTLKVLEEKESPPEESPRVRAFSIVSRQEYETLEREMEKLLGEKEQGDLEFVDEKTTGTGDDSTDITKETEMSEELKSENEELYNRQRARGRRVLDETKQDTSIKRYYIYASAVIIAILGAAAFYIISNRDLPETLTQQPAEENILTQEKKAPELIILDDKKTGEELPAGTVEVPEAVEKKEPPKGESVTKKIPADDKAADKKVASWSGNMQKKALTPPVKKIVPPKIVTTDKKTEASEKMVYSVQAGAFLNGANAATLSDRLRKKGYDAYIKKVVRPDKKTVHRVLIGKFDSEKKAVDYSELIRKKEGIKSFVYHYSS